MSTPAQGGVPPAEIQGRIGRFQERLVARGVPAALVTARIDRYYLAGTVQDGFLWVPAHGDPQLWILRDPGRARRESPLEVLHVRSGRELWARAREALRGSRPPGIVADTLPAAWLPRLGLDRADPWVDLGPDLLALRRRKSPWEVGRMAEAARVAGEVFRHAAEVLRPGMTEAELAGLLFARAMALGHEGRLWSRGPFEAYSWHVVSGPNLLAPGAVDTPVPGVGRSPAFPVGAGDRPIRRGEPVVVDFGVSVWGYQTDQTRTFCIGPPPAWLADLHGAVVRVLEALERRLAPGLAVADLYRAGEQEARAAGLHGYLGVPPQRCRFVGHGVGLETVEPPLVAPVEGRVEPGDALALEPKAVLPGLGAAGVEDTWWVGPDGVHRLTDFPRDLWVV